MEYTVCDSIYTKFQDGESSSMLTDVTTLVVYEGMGIACKGAQKSSLRE